MGILVILLLIGIFLARPIALIYYLLIYSFFNGITQVIRIEYLTMQIGPVSVYPLDVAFAALFALLAKYALGRMTGRMEPRIKTPEAKLLVLLVVLYTLYIFGRVAAGYFQGVPADSSVRFFLGDGQAIYLLLPLLFIKQKQQLTKLLYATIALSIAFPLVQPFLTESEGAIRALKGQGTFRLGYGDFNVILAIAVLAFFAWEQKRWLAILPLTGILFLAHRSAYIMITLSLILVSVLRGKAAKTVVGFGISGIFLIIMIVVIQNVAGSRSAALQHGADRIGETFSATGTTTGRLYAIKANIDVFLDKPIFGLSYAEQYQLIQQAKSSSEAVLIRPHNFVVRALSRGIINAVLLFWILGYLLLCAKRLSRTPTPGNRESGSLLLSSMFFFMGFATMNTTLGSIGYVLWIQGGIMLWLLQENASPTQTETSDIPNKDSVLSRKKSALIGHKKTAG